MFSFLQPGMVVVGLLLQLFYLVHCVLVRHKRDKWYFFSELPVFDKEGTEVLHFLDQMSKKDLVCFFSDLNFFSVLV